MLNSSPAFCSNRDRWMSGKLVYAMHNNEERKEGGNLPTMIMMSWMPGEYREISQIRWCAKKYFSWIVFSSWDILLPWQGWQKWPPFTSNWESVPPLLILVYKFQSWSVRIGEIYSNSEHISSIWPYGARQENHQTSRQYFQICSLCSNTRAYSNCRTKWSSLLLQPLLTHFPREGITVLFNKV